MVGFDAFITMLILLPTMPFDVFFSCKGEYSHTTFTDDLYSAYFQAGIRIFGADDGVSLGENTGLAIIERTIFESKLSVIVFSKEHATSRRCLDELVIIMERRITDGYVVIPVFYNVDPSDVRELTGAYGEAFEEHKKMLGENMEDRVEGWKTALKEVADVKGISLNKRGKSQFIQHIVQETENKLHPQVPDVAPYSFWNNLMLKKLVDSLRWIILLTYLPEVKRAIYASTIWVIETVKGIASWIWAYYHRIMNRPQRTAGRILGLIFCKVLQEGDGQDRNMERTS